MTNGYYYATFQSVTMSCYNATSAPGTNTGVSYTYNNIAGTNNTVIDGNEPTILDSFLDTGLNPTAGASASGSSTPSSTAQSIPGLSGGGSGTNPGSGESSSSSSASSSTQTSSSSSGSGSGSGFSQGGTGSTSSGADKLGMSQERVLKGSLFAGIVAVVGMMAL
jgi:hypothetical protein